MDEEDRHNTLEYKEHSEYFTLYYESKDRFVKALNMAYTDFKYIEEAFATLFIYVGNCTAQINKDVSAKDIHNKRMEIVDLIGKKEYIKALDVMNDFFGMITNLCSEAQIEPKPELKKKADYHLVKHAIDNAFKAAVGN